MFGVCVCVLLKKKKKKKKKKDNADLNSRENEQQPRVLQSDFLLVSRHNYCTRRLCHSILSFPQLKIVANSS